MTFSNRLLELFVIAEGAETASQVQILREAGCEYAQGYYLGRPENKQSTGQKITSLLMDRG
jgi:EAL domain-containing protein (putative c-di-GMP-specific phosphodiesterase class I)